MRIARSFKLGSIEISTSFDEKNDHDGNLGVANYDLSTISLSKTSNRKKINRDKIEQVYLHEVVHHILNAMQDDKKKDEKFVDTFARFLHQFLNTSEESGEINGI